MWPQRAGERTWALEQDLAGDKQQEGPEQFGKVSCGKEWGQLREQERREKCHSVLRYRRGMPFIFSWEVAGKVICWEKVKIWGESKFSYLYLLLFLHIAQNPALPSCLQSCNYLPHLIQMLSFCLYFYFWQMVPEPYQLKWVTHGTQWVSYVVLRI